MCALTSPASTELEAVEDAEAKDAEADDAEADDAEVVESEVEEAVADEEDEATVSTNWYFFLMISAAFSATP